MRTDENLREICHRVTNVYAKVANERVGCHLPLNFPLQFDLQDDSVFGARCAGLAISDPILIRLSMPLLRDNLQVYIDYVIPHEISHVIIYEKFNARGAKVKGHGAEWREVMRIFGKDPKVSPSMEMKGLRTYRRGIAKRQRENESNPRPILLHQLKARNGSGSSDFTFDLTTRRLIK